MSNTYGSESCAKRKKDLQIAMKKITKILESRVSVDSQLQSLEAMKDDLFSIKCIIDDVYVAKNGQSTTPIISTDCSSLYRIGRVKSSVKTIKSGLLTILRWGK